MHLKIESDAFGHALIYVSLICIIVYVIVHLWQRRIDKITNEENEQIYKRLREAEKKVVKKFVYWEEEFLKKLDK